MPYQLSSPTPGVQSSGDGIVQGADGPREPPVGRPAGPSRDGCATVVGDRGQNVRVHLAITLVALIATVLAGTAVADRLKIPAPLFLIVVGAIGCYLPFVPQIHLEPEVVLVGLLPPLLYSAAIQTSLVDFAANRGSILLLSVGLVVATTFTVEPRCDDRGNCEVERASFRTLDEHGKVSVGAVVDVHLRRQ